jgi:hypothetical protein
MKLSYHLIVLFALALLIQLCTVLKSPEEVPYRQPHKTDTVKVEKIQKPVAADPIPPKRVVLAMADTVKRKAAERGTILRGVELKRDLVKVYSINPEGISQVTEIPDIPIRLPLVIDSAGNVAVDQKELKRIRRKEKWRKIGNKVLIVGSFVAGVALAAAIQ